MNMIQSTQAIATAEGLRDQQALDAEPLPRRPDPLSSTGCWRTPYIAMLLLALVGVTLRMPVAYWIIMTPVFGVICVVAGWRHFDTRDGRIELAYSQALSSFELIVSIYVLFSDVVQGVLNENSTRWHDHVAGARHLHGRTAGAGLADYTVGAILLLAVPAIGGFTSRPCFWWSPLWRSSPSGL